MSETPSKDPKHTVEVEVEERDASEQLCYGDDHLSVKTRVLSNVPVPQQLPSDAPLTKKVEMATTVAGL